MWSGGEALADLLPSFSHESILSLLCPKQQFSVWKSACVLASTDCLSSELLRLVFPSVVLRIQDY